MAGKKRKAGRIRPGDEYRSAMRFLIGQRWADLWAAVPAAVAGEDPEGVHQVRVASRRLRAAMDAAVDCFPARWYRPLHKAARDLTGALGDARDQDVLLEAFTAARQRTRIGSRAAVDHMIARVQADRAAARERMLAYLVRLESEGLQRKTSRRFPGPARSGSAGPDAETAS